MAYRGYGDYVDDAMDGLEQEAIGPKVTVREVRKWVAALTQSY